MNGRLAFPWFMLPKIPALMVLLTVQIQSIRAGQGQPQSTEAPPVSTQTGGQYNFLIASGFLCGAEHSGDCPAVAQAANGQSIEISGAGTLNPDGNSVTAVGAFTEKSPAGEIVSTGIWTATALVNFQFYGIAPGALPRDYPELRTAGVSAKGGPMASAVMMAGPRGNLMAGPLAAGGLAVIRIRLLPDEGSPKGAELRANCALGKVPEDDPSDGVQLTVNGSPPFDRQVSGSIVFLVRRNGRDPAAKNSEAAAMEP